ncbi:hypothetical protein H5410_054511 [Solanum commersonii]|uniref:Uncharacterized protein n=1 Tax=Solanum commersonii TaxID=4109 RepID=A0A9J5WF53_SOLCO|nr:hypothetical protein H5410_054511 [Solanum commersonii]
MGCKGMQLQEKPYKEKLCHGHYIKCSIIPATDHAINSVNAKRDPHTSILRAPGGGRDGNEKLYLILKCIFQQRNQAIYPSIQNPGDFLSKSQQKTQYQKFKRINFKTRIMMSSFFYLTPLIHQASAPKSLIKRQDCWKINDGGVRASLQVTTCILFPQKQKPATTSYSQLLFYLGKNGFQYHSPFPQREKQNVYTCSKHLPHSHFHHELVGMLLQFFLEYSQQPFSDVEINKTFRLPVHNHDNKPSVIFEQKSLI